MCKCMRKGARAMLTQQERRENMTQQAFTPWLQRTGRTSCTLMYEHRLSNTRGRIQILNSGFLLWAPLTEFQKGPQPASSLKPTVCC